MSRAYLHLPFIGKYDSIGFLGLGSGYLDCKELLRQKGDLFYEIQSYSILESRLKTYTYSDREVSLQRHANFPIKLSGVLLFSLNFYTCLFPHGGLFDCELG